MSPTLGRLSQIAPLESGRECVGNGEKSFSHFRGQMGERIWGMKRRLSFSLASNRVPTEWPTGLTTNEETTVAASTTVSIERKVPSTTRKPLTVGLSLI